MKILGLFSVVILGLALGISCSSSPSNGDQGTGGLGGTENAGGSGGSGGIGDKNCKRVEYASPGCGVSPICTNGTGGACYQVVCSCTGKVMSGCGLFPEAYAYVFTGDFEGSPPDTCDPTADAGH
jgi:hypothetical protein